MLSFTAQESIIVAQDNVSTVIEFDNLVQPKAFVTTQLNVVSELMVVVIEGDVLPVGVHKKVYPG